MKLSGLLVRRPSRSNTDVLIGLSTLEVVRVSVRVFVGNSMRLRFGFVEFMGRSSLLRSLRFE